MCSRGDNKIDEYIYRQREREGVRERERNI
jgi:hypothetical protein